jgi:hypothetical protein
MPDLNESLDRLVCALVRQARTDDSIKEDIVTHCRDILNRFAIFYQPYLGRSPTQTVISAKTMNLTSRISLIPSSVNVRSHRLRRHNLISVTRSASFIVFRRVRTQIHKSSFSSSPPGNSPPYRYRYHLITCFSQFSQENTRRSPFSTRWLLRRTNPRPTLRFCRNSLLHHPHDDPQYQVQQMSQLRSTQRVNQKQRYYETIVQNMVGRLFTFLCFAYSIFS